MIDTVSPEKPYLAAAFICERLLTEKDGVMSAIRIVDTYFLDFKSPLPEGSERGIHLMGLVSFKGGPGDHKVRLSGINPKGKRALESPEFQLTLKGGEYGSNLIMDLGLPTPEEGLYWIDVYLDESLVTRIPLRIRSKEPQDGQKQGNY